MTTEEMEVLVNEYGTSLYRFCCHLTGNVPEAEDLYQGTFLKTVELSHKLDRCGDGKPSSIPAFSSSSIIPFPFKNLWKNKKRKSLWRRNIVSETEFDDLRVADTRNLGGLEEAVVKQELLDEVNRLVGSLPEKQKIIMNMYYAAEMSIEEISDNLKISRKTVRSSMSKARTKIRSSLEASGYEI